MLMLIMLKVLLTNTYESPINSENLSLYTYIFNEYKLKLHSCEKECKVIEDI